MTSFIFRDLRLIICANDWHQMDMNSKFIRMTIIFVQEQCVHLKFWIFYYLI